MDAARHRVRSVEDEGVPERRHQFRIASGGRGIGFRGFLRVPYGFSLRHLRLRAFDRKTFNREVREGIAKIAKKNKLGIFGAS
jgi:hypothetical protein